MRAFVSIPLLIAALALSSCGGGGGDPEEVKATLDKALQGSIRSADLELDAQISIDGLKGFERPVRIQASGVYVGAKDTIPKLDIDITAGSPEAGQTIQAGLLSTGDRAFVKFGSGYYEQPQADVTRANRELRRGSGGRSVFAGIGVDPRDWIVDAESRGGTEVGGVAVERFRGKLDLKAMFTDLNKVVDRSANVVGSVGPKVPEALSPKQIDSLAEVVENPSFDIYVGKDDGLVRRLSGNLKVSVPEEERARFSDISRASLKFSLELSKLNGSQAVVAPRDVRPISELAKALGGIGALTGADALGGDGTTGTGTETTPDQAYSECLDRAEPGDIKALDRCRELLP